MRRADRLFQIVNYLRRHKIATARQIARALEVSERTIYRDMADLSVSGLPLEAEAGVGYRLGPQCDLPPLMLDALEIEALTLGARMTEAWGDDRLAQAARSLLDKVSLVLPKDLQHEVEASTLFAPEVRIARIVKDHVGVVRTALRKKLYLELKYQRKDGERSSRRVRPLGLYFWGWTWSLIAYCELRKDFRNFRLDRFEEVVMLDQTFPIESGKMLQDYFKIEREKAYRHQDKSESYQQNQ